MPRNWFVAFVIPFLLLSSCGSIQHHRILLIGIWEIRDFTIVSDTTNFAGLITILNSGQLKGSKVIITDCNLSIISPDQSDSITYDINEITDSSFIITDKSKSKKRVTYQIENNTLKYVLSEFQYTLEKVKE